MMKKKVGIGLVVIAFLGLGFYLYTQKLHALVYEGNKNFVDRCLNVNPYLISYKEAFLSFAGYLNSGEVDDPGFMKSFNDYVTGVKAYVVAEDKWLEKQKAYFNRWDFQLFMPWYIKKAADLQIKMYEAYRDDAKYIEEIYDAGGNTPGLQMKYGDVRTRRNDAEYAYNDWLGKMYDGNDWRTRYLMAPYPEGCTEDNMRIPDTRGVLNGEATPSASPALTIDWLSS